MNVLRRTGVSSLRERSVSSSRVWWGLEFEDFVLSLKSANSGPSVGTQATMIDTFSSALDGRSALIDVVGEETYTASKLLLTLVSMFTVSRTFIGNFWTLKTADEQVISLCALSSPVRTVRATASDPQLSMRKISVMSLLSIQKALSALTKLRKTLAAQL